MAIAAAKLKVGTDLAHDENHALEQLEENQYVNTLAMRYLRAKYSLQGLE